MRVTMAEVAARAGVSVATVSHTINGTRPVSEAVRERVERAIAETDYRRHDLARALKRARTDSVGLVVSDTGHPVFAQLIRGVEEVARATGQTLILTNSSDSPERELEVVDALRQRRVDGLLIVPAVGSGDLVARLAEDGLPVVVVDRLTAAPVDQVGVDSDSALRKLAGHLATRGHDRVAIVAGTLALEINEQRVGTCTAALMRLGVSPGDIVVLHSDSDGTTEEPVEAAIESVVRHLADERPATGLITLNAHQTVGAMEALRRAGRSVPRDVALVAFDDLPWSRLITPGITCVAQPAAQMGREAMRLLARRIDDPDVPHETLRLHCKFVHRESCGCPPEQSDLRKAGVGAERGDDPLPAPA